MVINRFIQSAKAKQSLITKHFMQVASHHQVSHAYLFSGEAGVGKLSVALTIAMRLFCPHVKSGYPCGHCNECTRITNHQHPDILMIRPQGQRIRIHQIRFLRSEFTKSAVEGNLKIFIIDKAEKMTVSAANSLLKFIEEPQGNVICFLLTSNPALILPTIVSRTQVVKFPSLTPRIFNPELREAGIDPDQYNLIGTMTNNLTTAKQWNQNDGFGRLQNIVSDWFKALIHGNYIAFPNIQIQVMPLVHQPVDKEIIINMMIQIWCDVLDRKLMGLKRRKVKFPQVFNEIKWIASRIRVDRLLKIINLMLFNNVLFKQNVSFQHILEAATLKVLITLRS